MEYRANMRFTSIRVKLFIIIIIALLGSAVSILLIADRKLTDIIDSSKNALYRERVDKIWSVIYRNNERLKKTGLVEAYLDDFRASTLNDLKSTYYSMPDLSIYPFIIDTDGNIVLHPTLPKNATPPDLELADFLLEGEQGDLEYVYQGTPKYYTFRRFPEWQWVIAYTVPLDIKYAEARRFRDLLIIIMGAVTLVMVPVLLLVITRFARPVTRLTNAARAMAKGDLNKEIDLAAMTKSACSP